MAKQPFEKYNILLVILVFVIPLVAINCSFWFISKINFDLELKEQEKEALHEAESLSIEGNFNNEFAMHFRDYFDEVIKNARDESINDSNLVNNLDESAKRIFNESFPKYNLYVFRIPNETNKTELLYYWGSVKSGKNVLCKAFEHLYTLNSTNKKDSNESFAKQYLGKYTDIKVIANETRGLTSFTNGAFKNSWFIWDYENIDDKGIFGAFLFCDEINDYAKYGRQLAFNKLKIRGRALGAFIPIYKLYGEPLFQSPLDKFDKFKNWANKLTVNSSENLEKWLKESLPQGEKIGNYTAFCYLGRGDSHIAVVLVKSLKRPISPKWLIGINIIFLFSLFVILYCGIVLRVWPPLSLRARFVISYALASVVPLSLLSVTAYGYWFQYQNTSIEKANNELQMTLKSIDSNKSNILKDYRETFEKVINNPELIKLIEKEGINNETVPKYVVDSFETNNTDRPLPLLGVRIYDEVGNGAFSLGSDSMHFDFQAVCSSYEAALVELLRDEIKKEDKDIVLKDYESEPEKKLADQAYETVSTRNLKEDLARYFSIPLPRKNGNYCNYFIYDFIKINNKSKYLLFVFWDDNALDEKIVQDAFFNLKNQEHNFVAYKINGQKIDPVGEKTKHASENLIIKIKDLAKQSFYFKKTETFVDNENIIFAMPAMNFNQIVFVGWINKIEIILSLFNMKNSFIFLFIISLLFLWIYSLHSSSVFVQPLTSLKKALDEVSSGNLNIGLNNNSKDELGSLSDEFSKMIDELREKERLSKLLSDQAVQALKKDSSELLNDTETFKGVALVSDIRNFTGMSEKYDPGVITELLNEHFAEMAKIISDNGGLIYKFIGDAIEAVFPEKEEYDKSASERAFKAGYLMISKLAVINSRRKNKGLFPYRIGVGLCYGTMFSGTVGSIETRLDYTLLGEPLKNAAKFEALSKQNPDFPIVIGEDIAEKMAAYGFSFKKIDSKGFNFPIYTFSANRQADIPSSSGFSLRNKNEKEDNNKKNVNIKLFSISNDSTTIKQIINYLFNLIFILFLSFLITYGICLIYDTGNDDLRMESKKSVSRLFEQLKCRDVLKSCFETVCFDFFEDINKALNSENNSEPFKQTIEKIAVKYEKKGLPFPYYCAFSLNGNNINNDAIVFDGFKEDAYKLFKEYVYNFINGKAETSIMRDIVKTILGPVGNSDSFYSELFRRSSFVTVLKDEMFLDTERIYDKDHKNLIAYIFCGFPNDTNNKLFPKYYTVLAGKQLFMAIRDNNSWYFSNDFPQEEKDYLKNTSMEEIQKSKGYSVSELEINNKTYWVYAISKDLLLYYKSPKKLSIISFCLSLFIMILLSLFMNKIKMFANNSIAGILRKDIILSAIIPLVTVTFVSFLYVEEEFNNNKAQVALNLNNRINENEIRELYYNPLCENFLKTLPEIKEVKNLISNIINSKSEDRNELCASLSTFLNNNIIEKKYKDYKKILIDPQFDIREICIVGKDGWISSASASENKKNNKNENKNISIFGEIMSEVFKTICFDSVDSSKDLNDTQAATSEIFAVKFIKTLSTNYGSDLSFRLINFPNKLIILSSSFSSIGFYLNAYPDIYKPEYILISLIFFDNVFISKICEDRNDVQNYKNYLDSGSITDYIYSFYSTCIDVGRHFFFIDDKYNNTKEELRTVKELGLVASWLNTSYIPVSKKVDIDGIHYLEARQGNIVKDNVYAALASEYPIRQNALNKVRLFSSILIFSLIMILLIAQSIISDFLYPVKQLINGAVAASKGNFKYRTQFYRGDELGALCVSFDKMMKGLEEKQLMNRMVSKTALKVTSDISYSESKKVDVALLYVTVPDFDKIMKNTSSFELFSKLRKQIAIISEIVIENGGDIDKIMGEKLLVAFRIGDKSPEEVAINASKVASLIENNDNLSFKVAVGVNYGQVISGYLGVGEKRDFTIIGDPVNVAARIAVFAEKQESNRLIVSEGIMKLIEKNIKTEEYGEVLFKGKSQAAKVYRIL